MRIYLISLGLALFVWSVEDAQPDKNLLFLAIVPDDPHARKVLLIWHPVSLGEDSLNESFIRNFEAGHRESITQAGGKVTKLRRRDCQRAIGSL